MAKAKFINTKISGIVSVIPNNVKWIDDEIELYGGDVQQIARIKKTIGLSKRHVTDAKTTAADLCEVASLQLFRGIAIEKEKIDALILVTTTPDYFAQPCTAAYLHGKLGLSKDCACFDVNLACSGYVYGLWLAHMMTATDSCRNVLLLAGDTVSKLVNPRDRATAPLFGDAGTATLIQREENSPPSFFALHTDGKGFNSIIVIAGGSRNPRTAETAKEIKDDDGNIRSLENIFMNGGEVFNFSIKEEPLAIEEILKYSNNKIENMDYVVFHQANKYIIGNIARRLNLPLEKAPCATVEKYGNQSSASIPVTICDSLSQEVSSGRRKIIMSGFGAGLSWASCLMELDNIYCPPVIISGESHGGGLVFDID